MYFDLSTKYRVFFYFFRPMNLNRIFSFYTFYKSFTGFNLRQLCINDNLQPIPYLHIKGAGEPTILEPFFPILSHVQRIPAIFITLNSFYSVLSYEKPSLGHLRIVHLTFPSSQTRFCGLYNKNLVENRSKSVFLSNSPPIFKHL